MDLNALEQDALTEVINIGVSRAATSLSTMAGDEVLLSVPAISIVNAGQAGEMLGGRRVGQMVAVEETFSGEISGRALLIFPEPSSLELVKAVTGDEIPVDQMAEMAPEALCETGNILLQTCLSTMANILHRTVAIGVPKLIRARAGKIFAETSKTTVLFVYINFRLRGRRIRGYVALLLDVPSLAVLKGLLGELIDRESGGVAPEPAGG